MCHINCKKNKNRHIHSALFVAHRWKQPSLDGSVEPHWAPAPGDAGEQGSTEDIIKTQINGHNLERDSAWVRVIISPWFLKLHWRVNTASTKSQQTEWDGRRNRGRRIDWGRNKSGVRQRGGRLSERKGDGDKIGAANVITAQHRDGGEHCFSQWLLSPAIKCIRDDASGSACGGVNVCVRACVRARTNTPHFMLARVCAYCFEMTPQSAAWVLWGRLWAR